MNRKKQADKSTKGSAQKKVDWKALEVVHPDAAGIDIGGSEHWVAISPERDEQPVRCFECYTADLEEMADWLVERGVRSVAMQSTGVYWIPVFENTATARSGSLSGQRTAHQELAWPKERHRGMSVVVEATHVRATKQQLPAERRDPDGAHPVAT